MKKCFHFTDFYSFYCFQNYTVHLRQSYVNPAKYKVAAVSEKPYFGLIMTQAAAL